MSDIPPDPVAAVKSTQDPCVDGHTLQMGSNLCLVCGEEIEDDEALTEPTTEDPSEPVADRPGQAHEALRLAITGSQFRRLDEGHIATALYVLLSEQDPGADKTTAIWFASLADLAITALATALSDDPRAIANLRERLIAYLAVKGHVPL